ncbi:alpha-1,3-mannosyl-glycoprotein 2-beta-N-acetylglucosaminyltransferase isoform X2 [Venturia canescens]|uniref:alpha-1,3-mannosyl-glycoprotein 2-beta-N-acetylglucosaminyltransferase isoform X2 n=1 Tax=Venturia canescens TaxID=32260 RepID=UPI001C9C20F1|nr:alpha-1,3-mannosyl-glycoprotein 2-beta-N-acetylglucosaminyltransferase isoform X2 [Venturia canescens]
MRNRSIGLIFISIFIWGVITYFLFLDRPIGRQNEHALTKQIKKLSSEVKHQISANQQLFQRLLQREQNKMEEKKAAAAHSSPEKIIESDVKDEGDTGIDKDFVEKTSTKSNVDLIPNVFNPEDVSKKKAKLREEKLRGIAKKKTLPNGSPIIAVLVLSCDRLTVRRCLDQLIKQRKNAEQFPIIVSQDCVHKETATIIESYGDQVVHIQQPDQSDMDIPLTEKKFKGYFKIARHYGWALNHVFVELEFDTVIIVEDDLDIAPDFYEYFLGTYPILVADESLWCVSAWNDNGKSGLVDENAWKLLYRTDFFPGLGWMLTRKLWSELSPKWPRAYWDDWIRQPQQRKNRACIRPELSRTRTFGKIGVSNGLFYEKHLKFIKLNEEFVHFTEMNLTYLLKIFILG